MVVVAQATLHLNHIFHFCQLQLVIKLEHTFKECTQLPLRVHMNMATCSMVEHWVQPSMMPWLEKWPR